MLERREEGNLHSLHRYLPMWRTVDGDHSLVDDHRHAVCQALHKGIEGEVWERSYCKCAEIHKAVNVRKPGNHHKAKASWMLREANTTGGACCDRSRLEPQCGKLCGRRTCKARCQLLKRP